LSVITTDRLTRRFGPVIAVNQLDLQLPTAGVIGVVGPNGSGKSTLIRMLLGLIEPTAGSATVLGSSIDRPGAYAHDVGALIEAPAFLAGLSARRNLLSLARLRGLPSSRVDEVLEIVGLLGREREPVKTYSLGMKQRLGIAAALLPDPSVLILDEPTNGLDPAGIVEIRSLLQRLGQSGRTVIVSSHLLAEIEAACDHVVVIRFGELVFSGPTTELMARTRAHVDVAPEHEDEIARLGEALALAGWETQPISGGLRIATDRSDAAAINRAASAAGITLSGLVAAQDSLEDIFLAMTGTTDGELARSRATAKTGVTK
jgi:ABC-2 type transport system ATP-binding protein